MIFGKGPTQGLEHNLTAEKVYSINFIDTRNKFFLSLHYNGANSYLFVNGAERCSNSIMPRKHFKRLINR